MNRQLTSLWTARRQRGRRVGERGRVFAYECPIPGEALRRPMLSVCTLDDDEAWEECTSCIWALTEKGKAFAERIARDLLALGFAWVWLHEADHVRIVPGAWHHVHTLGFVEVDHE